MVNHILWCTTAIFIIPEACWECITYPHAWHSYLAALVALLAIANHSLSRNDICQLDRLVVACIAVANIVLVPALWPLALLTSLLYFGIVRDVRYPQSTRNACHILVHMIGVYSSIRAVGFAEQFI